MQYSAFKQNVDAIVSAIQMLRNGFVPANSPEYDYATDECEAAARISGADPKVVLLIFHKANRAAITGHCFSRAYREVRAA